ncbi:MAG: EamA family transporter [Gammaproteobacteria bacterium]
MLSNWVVLALISALSIACADAATKRFFSDVDIWDTLVVRVVLTGFVMAPWVFVNVEPPTANSFWSWVGFLACLDLVALFLYSYAITTAPLSHTLPYLGLAPVFSALTSFVLLGEAISRQGMLGIVLVSVGAYRLNGDVHAKGLLAPFKFLFTETGPRLILIVALIFGMTATLGKGALSFMPPAQFGPFYAMLLGAVVWLALIVQRRPVFAIIRRRPLASTLVSAMMSLMVLTHFLALQLVEVSYMIAVKRTSVIFGLLLGAWLFREGNLRNNLIACAVMVSGVALIVAR